MGTALGRDGLRIVPTRAFAALASLVRDSGAASASPDQVAAMLRQTRGSMIIASLAAFSVLIVYWPDRFWSRPTGWWALMQAVTLARFLLAAAYLAGPVDPARTRRYERRSFLGWVASAALWGAAGWMFFDPTQLQASAFLIAVLMGIAATSAGGGSFVRPYGGLALIPMLGPVTIALSGVLGVVGALGSALIVIYGGIVFTASVRHVMLTRSEARYRAVNARREEDLLAALTAADTASRAKSDFLATMSHEIRTPLNGIIGMLDLLASAPLAAEHRQWLEIAQRSSRDLLTIINDILDLSKLEVGKMRVDPVDFNLADMVSGAIGLLAPRAAERGDAIDIRIAPGVPTWISADERLIRQILLNIVGNAVKFTEKGRILVEVGRRGTGADLTLIWSVTDTGIGIPAEAQAMIFGDFAQAETSTTRRYGGTGLGLAICRRLVGLLGGEIGVVSAPGQGARFWFTTPCQEGQPRAPTAESHGPEPGPQGPSGAALRVLVAEDNPINQIYVAQVLRRQGHEPMVVTTGRAAVEACAQGTFDLVLMDIQMPEMDGVEATRAIRALPPPQGRMPIIALTANAFADQRRAYLDAGMNDCVTKPVIPETLFAAIRRATAAPRSGELPL